jgi:hypothetical protein
MRVPRLLLAVVLLIASGVLAASVERPATVRPAENPRRVWAAAQYPGWQAWNVADPFVLRDTVRGRYLLFYAGAGTGHINASTWEDWSIGLAESQDGRAFDVPDDYDPVLVGRRWMEGDVIDPDDLGSTFDSVAVFAPFVLRENGVYRMWYAGWNGDSVDSGGGKDRMVHQRIGLATSKDGRTWVKQRAASNAGAVLGLGPANGPDAEGVGRPWVRRDRGGYRMWYEAADGRTARVLTATSRDGLTWERVGVALDAGPAEAPDARGASRPLVIERRGRLELWYQGLARDGQRHLLRAASRDGVHWTRLPGEIDVWSGRAPQSEFHVGSVLVEPTGACRVYFASRRALPAARDGAAREGFEVFVVTVNP